MTPLGKKYWLRSVYIGIAMAAWPLILGIQEIDKASSGDTVTSGLLFGIFDLPGVLVASPLLLLIPRSFTLEQEMLWTTICLIAVHFAVGTLGAAMYYDKARNRRPKATPLPPSEDK